MAQAASKPTPAHSDWLTPRDLSERFGVSRRRIYDWLVLGWLRGARKGGRWHIAVPDADFFALTCRGYRGHLMPSLYEWRSLYPQSADQADSSAF